MGLQLQMSSKQRTQLSLAKDRNCPSNSVSHPHTVFLVGPATSTNAHFSDYKDYLKYIQTLSRLILAELTLSFFFNSLVHDYLPLILAYYWQVLKSKIGFLIYCLPIYVRVASVLWVVSIHLGTQTILV